MTDRIFDLDALTEFAAIPAPTGAEGARIDWLEGRLAGAPGQRTRDGVGNLVWRASHERPRTLVLAHVDTVFAADTPLRFTREADELVGPGIGDNAAAVIALVSVLERIGGPPPGTAIAFTVAEEGLGNLRGALFACDALAPASALAVEGHGLDAVITDHVGSLRARVAVSGPGGHSWWDRGTPSAVHALIELAGQLMTTTGAGAGVNVGRVSGGGAVNAIAAHAEMLVECRSLEEAELSAFGAQLDALAVAPPLALSCELVGHRPAGRLPDGHPLRAMLMDVRGGLGLPERVGSGSTDANAAAALGIPAAAIGCARGSGMHTVGERIDVPSLELGCRQLEAVLRALGRG